MSNKPPLSEERKRSLSEYWKGKKKPETQRLNIGLAKIGKNNPNFGKKPSEETLIKRSKALKGKKAWNKGLKCPQLATGWKGGVSNPNEIARHSMEFREWREKVFSRDNWTCQKCKRRGVVLHPHHIDNFSEFPELRFNDTNGITLCKDCHVKFHQEFGKSHNNHMQVLRFIIHSESYVHA
jgi:hypothetical protein